MTKAEYIAEAKKAGIPNILLKSGEINDYRLAQLKFQAGNRKEKTFDKSISKRGGHSCCRSKVEWRHKVTCPRLIGFGTL